MARISTYVLDEDITGGDKWIGSDSGFYNKTKNFTPIKLADYFNSSESIRSANSLMFTYQTLDPFEERLTGTISFKDEIGATVNFSSITEILISKTSKSYKYIADFLLGTNDSIVILHKSDDINKYGLYNITLVEEDIDESDFLYVQMQFIQGNSSIEEDKDYLFSVIDFNLSENKDKNYVHNQVVASNTWSVSHNLNKYPSVTIVDSGENVVIGDVQYIDLNNIKITFTSTFSGKAYFN
jgi:hypothetical protein